jgi:hypothetical protein
MQLPWYDLNTLLSRNAYEFLPPKPQELDSEMKDLFAFIWMRDTEHLEHPRYHLQTALAILLFFYLGLHPIAALNDGLHYEDTLILLKRHENKLRAILLIRLDRRSLKSPKHWRGHVNMPSFEDRMLTLYRRTMMLTDLPYNRTMCPVTLFLSLAIADGVFEGISCSKDLASFPTDPTLDWVILPYRPDTESIPVFRRTGNKSKTLTSRAMKASLLHKSMQAQISRAGHDIAFAKLQQDVRKASSRETRRGYL